MKLKSNQPKASAEQVVKDIRRATRRHYSTEDKIRIVGCCRFQRHFVKVSNETGGYQ